MAHEEESTSSLQAPADASVQRPFSLTRWFLVLSLLSILITSMVSAFFLSRFLEQTMLRRDAVVTMEFVNSAMRAQGASAYLIDTDAEPGRDVFEALFTQIANLPDVLRANVYSRDRSIIWSSNPRLIGVEFKTNPELDKALAGDLVIEKGFVGDVDKAEHAFLEGMVVTGETQDLYTRDRLWSGSPESQESDATPHAVAIPGSQQSSSLATSGDGYFIENYLPVYDTPGGRVIGVVEVYKSPTAVFGAIDKGRTLIWVSAAMSALVLYLALFWIIRRASSVMRVQQDRLVATETLAAIGEMASAVAHGLRNPLATIRSSAELSLEERLPDPVRESLTDIVVQSDRLDTWVRELLGSMRSNAIEFEALRINDIVKESVDLASAELARRGVDLSLQLEDSLPGVRGNSTALRQVVHSLVSNAAEAMHDGDKLRVSTRSDANDRAVLVEVYDTGSGIPEGQMQRVFQPFFTSKGTGLGVGLSLAKRIVERHRGSLQLAQPKAGGTIATIKLPAKT